MAVERRILVVDVGGNNVKCWTPVVDERRKAPSGPRLTPEAMVASVLALTGDWDWDAVSLGVPGPVVGNMVARDPVNLGRGWVGFDFTAAFGRPTRVVNDAVMQALGCYEGGRMLFLGLGTGLGTAMVVDKVVVPLELAHLPYRKDRTFEDYVGIRGLQKRGKKKWTKAVEDVVARLKAALVADYVVLGGGNSKNLARLPTGCRLGDNKNAFIGGYRLWEEEYSRG